MDVSALRPPVPYSPALEVEETDEDKTTRALAQVMQHIADITHKDTGQSLRSVHAKSHGLLYGKLHVQGGLPDVLAQGLFAQAASYPVVMRFSTTPGDILDDSVSTPRGLAVKVDGVRGERLPGSEGDVTQDFLLVNGPAFQSSSGASFLRSLKLLAATTDTPQAPKKVVSAVMRAAEAFIEAFGGKSATLLSLGGQPQTHILGETFFSQVPILYGRYMAKVAITPVSPELVALTDAPLDVAGKPNALREAVVDFFRANSGMWEMRVQLCNDLDSMPIENPTAVWPEEMSPYLTVARIEVAAQQAWSEERHHAIDNGLAFNPWHGLAAHRPLGRIMRMRKLVYQEIAKSRLRRSSRAP